MVAEAGWRRAAGLADQVGAGRLGSDLYRLGGWLVPEVPDQVAGQEADAAVSSSCGTESPETKS